MTVVVAALAVSQAATLVVLGRVVSRLTDLEIRHIGLDFVVGLQRLRDR